MAVKKSLVFRRKKKQKQLKQQHRHPPSMLKPINQESDLENEIFLNDENRLELKKCFKKEFLLFFYLLKLIELRNQRSI